MAALFRSSCRSLLRQPWCCSQCLTGYIINQLRTNVQIASNCQAWALCRAANKRERFCEERGWVAYYFQYGTYLSFLLYAKICSSTYLIRALYGSGFFKARISAAAADLFIDAANSLMSFSLVTVTAFWGFVFDWMWKSSAISSSLLLELTRNRHR